MTEPDAPITREPLAASSHLLGIAYDPERRILEVEFANGAVWRYHDVAAATWHGLKAAPSKGGYFHQHVRSAHRASEVAPAPVRKGSGGVG